MTFIMCFHLVFDNLIQGLRLVALSHLHLCKVVLNVVLLNLLSMEKEDIVECQGNFNVDVTSM